MRWRALLVVVAGAAAVLPIPRGAIESLYSARFFPLFQRFATRTSNHVPIALFDILVVGVAVGWAAMSIRDLRHARQSGWRILLAAMTVRTVTVAAAAYLAFLIAWGFNYRRIPLEGKLRFDAGRVSSSAAVALANRVVAQMNTLHDTAHRNGWADGSVIDRSLAEAFARASGELGFSPDTVPALPKQTIFDLYFRRAGVSGMTDPYFLETLVASDLLPFERPFVVAHEWGHLAGLGDEGDANFLAWLTCLRGTPAHQYSGWLSIYSEVVGGLDRPHAVDVSGNLNEGPRADLRAIRDRFLKNVDPRVSAAGWRVYDQYLKANRIEEGAASYADVVRLILGTTFSEDWKPERR